MIKNRIALFIFVFASGTFNVCNVWADNPTPTEYLEEAKSAYRDEDYYRAAKLAFAAAEAQGPVEAEAYATITLSLMQLAMPNAASYFFIRTLQSGHKPAIKRVLTETQELFVRTSGDLLRRYLVRHTSYDDYDTVNKSAYLYSLGKDLLLKGEAQKAVGYLNGVSSRSRLWPFVLQLRGTAHAILGRGEEALKDFRGCNDRASSYVTDSGRSNQSREAEDLAARCKASEARTLYQMSRFEDADRTYDSIPKGSLVWPDILFEQAWNGFAKQEYNKTLGKLVSYKSPALEFVFNSEVDVLRAQSYLALCLYADANDVINEFNAKYTRLGEEVKRFVENRSSNLKDFYDLGKQVLRNRLHTKNDMHRMVNRFIRGPYFQNLVAAESAIGREVTKISRYEPGDNQAGFAGFLNQVLGFRMKSVYNLGGAFVKNSLLDYHTVLIADFEKMAFIKLEMLGRAKARLTTTKPPASGGRNRGNIEPTRRDDQYRWGFNGEFWADELGDYVFGLESECS